jgi:hypothetical protein
MIDTLKELYTWIERRYADQGCNWSDPTFHCFEGLPDLLRWIYATDVVEVEIENGGPAQLLWNTFYHWRTLLGWAREGYLAMGFTTEAAAIAFYETLFSRFADECKRLIRETVPDGGIRDFHYFMAECGAQMDTESDKLFYSQSGLFDRKRAWADANRVTLMGLMDAT